jgi:hypothetical protein
MLKKISHNIMVQSFRCNHEGRAAIFVRFVHVRTEFINQASHDSQVSLLRCDVQWCAAILCASIYVSTKILNQISHDSQVSFRCCDIQGRAALFITQIDVRIPGPGTAPLPDFLRRLRCAKVYHPRSFGRRQP